MDQLPLYRVENWHSVESGTSAMMVHSGDENDREELIVRSRATHHGDGRRSVTVISSLPGDNDREEAWRRIAPDGSHPGKWASVNIAVDGHEQTFELAAAGSAWVALATVAGVTITITGRNVDAASLRLVEDRDAPAPEWHRPIRPEPRELTFPSTFEAVLGGSPSVDLTYRNRRALTGNLGVTAVELICDLPRHDGALRGRLGGSPVAARWSTNGEEVSLTGTFGTLPVNLEGRFGHEPSDCFDAGDVTGRIGLQVLNAHVERADGGLSTSTIYAEGALADVSFSLWATLEGDLTRGIVRGTVGGRPFELTATSDYHHLHIVGTYQGPDALLIVIVGSLANFI